MDTAVKIATNGRQVGFSVTLLSLSFSFALEKAFLQYARLHILLLAGTGEGLVEPWHTF